MKKEKADWTINEVISWTENYFERNGIPEPRLDAEVLLSTVLKCPRLDLLLKHNEKLNDGELDKYKGYIKERAARVPVAYITGFKEFMGFDFIVNRSTLIPRPETEIMVEETIKKLKEDVQKVVVDIGTGSGSIAVSIAKMTDVKKIYAVDVSEEALKVANENINKHGVAGKVVVRKSDMFNYLSFEGLENSIDIIVTNPPYVSSSEFCGLEPELGYEPHNALFGGTDGLDYYRRIASESIPFLKSEGYIFAEMNSCKSKDISKIFTDNGYIIENIIKDYSGLDRVIVLKKQDGLNNG